MPAVIVEIADALKGAIAAATLSLTPASIVRAYIPTYDLESGFDGLKVTVVPAELSLESLARRSDDFDYTIHVAVQKRLGVGLATEAAIVAAADPLMLYAEEVIDLFRGNTLDMDGSPTCIEAANRPIYSPDHMAEKRVFTGVIQLTFRMARART